MNGGHRATRNVRMRLHGDCLAGVILTDVLVHLLDAERLLALVIATKPQSRRPVIVVVGDVQVVGAGGHDVAFFRLVAHRLHLRHVHHRLEMCCLKAIMSVIIIIIR